MKLQKANHEKREGLLYILKEHNITCQLYLNLKTHHQTQSYLDFDMSFIHEILYFVLYLELIFERYNICF